MSRAKTFLLLVMMIAVAAAIAAIMITNRPEPPKQDVKKRVLLVESAVVHRRAHTIHVSAQGSISPRTQTLVISEVSGQVKAVSPALVAGGFFRKGETLLTIDDRYYQSALKRAEAAVASARSQLAQEKGRAEVAYSDWLKAGKPGKTQQARDLAMRKPQVAEAEANLASAIADLEKARSDLEHTVIKAPYDGLVREKQVDIGQYVSPGTLLAKTFAVDKAEVRLAIPDNRLAYLELPRAWSDTEPTPHPPVTLSATMGNDRHQWHGKLVRTEGVLDPASRVLYVVAQVEDPYNLRGIHDQETNYQPLRIGTFVEASIEGKTIDGLIDLPRSLLRAGNRIWVIDENNTLRNREVTALQTEGDTLYVDSGLADGERVCLTSVGNVLPGTPVKLVDNSNQTAGQ